MKKKFTSLLQNSLFINLMSGVFAYIALMATILAVLQVPPEAILDSGLDEVLLVFDDSFETS